MRFALWHLRRAARYLGAPGLVGLVLCVAAGAAGLGFERPLRDNVARQAFEMRHSMRTARAVSSAERTRDGIEHWVAALPQRGVLPEVIAQLAAEARANGLTLDRGQYDIEPISGTPMLQWRASFPVTGSYSQVRAFLADCLLHDPDLRLEGFALEREDAGTGTLHADLRFSLYLRRRG